MSRGPKEPHMTRAGEENRTLRGKVKKLGTPLPRAMQARKGFRVPNVHKAPVKGLMVE